MRVKLETLLEWDSVWAGEFAIRNPKCSTLQKFSPVEVSGYTVCNNAQVDKFRGGSALVV